MLAPLHQMMRTTLDIDAPLLRELKQLQKKEKKALGAIVSDLLAEALAWPTIFSYLRSSVLLGRGCMQV
jgi:hypothetical protein